MATELSFYIRPKKSKDNFVFVGFYGGSSVMIPIFNKKVKPQVKKEDIVTDEKEEHPDYIPFNKESYYIVKDELQKSENEINEQVAWAKRTNEEYRLIYSAIAAKAGSNDKALSNVINEYMSQKYSEDPNDDVAFEHTINEINAARTFITTLWEMYEESSIIEDGIDGIYFSIDY